MYKDYKKIFNSNSNYKIWILTGSISRKMAYKNSHS